MHDDNLEASLDNMMSLHSAAHALYNSIIIHSRNHDITLAAPCTEDVGDSRDQRSVSAEWECLMQWISTQQSKKVDWSLDICRTKR